MKTIVIRSLIVSFLIFSFKSFSQDIIYKADGSEIKASVIEIDDTYVKYKNFEQPDGPVRNIKKSELFLIIYKDGTKEKFTAAPPPDNSSSTVQPNADKKIEGNPEADNTNSEYQFQRFGYINIIEAGPIFVFSYSGGKSSNIIYRVNMINGALIGPFVSLGLGVGYERWPNGNLLPLYMDLRFNFVKMRFSPILVIDGGYTLGWMTGETGADWGGFALNPAIGFRGYFNKYCGMTLTVGYKLQYIKQYQYNYNYYGYNTSYSEDFTSLATHGICLKLGFIF